MGGLERTTQRLLGEIETRHEQGLSTFTVSFSQADVGPTLRLGHAATMIAEALQDAGHEVLEITSPVAGWSGECVLRVNAFSGSPPRPSLGKPLGAASNDEDPAKAKLHRALELSRTEPTGEAGILAEGLGPTVRQMRIAWDAGDYEAVWAKRMQFGVLSSGGADQPTWFWFNALPALAARRLGKTDHPLFGLACGNASAATDWDDPVQREAEAIFNRQ